MPTKLVEATIPVDRECVHCNGDRGVIASTGEVRPVCQSCGERCGKTLGFTAVMVNIPKLQAQANRRSIGDPVDHHKFARGS